MIIINYLISNFCYKSNTDNGVTCEIKKCSLPKNVESITNCKNNHLSDCNYSNIICKKGFVKNNFDKIKCEYGCII